MLKSCGLFVVKAVSCPRCGHSDTKIGQDWSESQLGFTGGCVH